LLIFGCGIQIKPISREVHEYLRSIQLPYELQSSVSACGTFNILNDEDRRVAACIIALKEEEYESIMSKREERKRKTESPYRFIHPSLKK
jgi:hypothetical protein